jgi:hypothetical protein
VAVNLAEEDSCTNFIRQSARLLPSLTNELRSIVGRVEQAGFIAKLGRYISVARTRSGYASGLINPVRCVTVVIAPNPGDDHTSVDLLASYELGTTVREALLAEGDTTVSREIRNDIEWCGHWEGRWFPYTPLDMPKWMRKSFQPV